MSAILDPFNHCPGLKILFPEYDYYCWEPSSFLHFTATNHMTNDQFEKMYGFRYLSDWTEISSDKYSTLFIVLPLLDCYPGNWCTKEEGVKIWRILEQICFLPHKHYKTICLFDTYDYDYDPSTLFPEVDIDVYFKRNMNKTKTYADNVKPFPYMIFLTPCPLLTLLTKQVPRPPVQKNEVFWSGGLYTHTQRYTIQRQIHSVHRDRETIFHQIQSALSVKKGLPHDQFLKEIAAHKFALDLEGVGDPNSRTFEIFLSESLRLFNNTNLVWNFDPHDTFSPFCSFDTSDEFFRNLNHLSDERVYKEALDQQTYLINKYMTKTALREYIVSCFQT
jgi:hypothetical protein